MDLQELIDRESIRRTLARYTLCGDRGRIDDLVACFATDGVLELEGEWTARGHDGIREQTTAAAQLLAGRSGERTLLRHHVSTQGIELDSGSEARAWSYFMAVTANGPDHVGRYVDRLGKVGDEWRILHRLVCVEWWSRDTIYDEVAERARRRRERENPTTRVEPGDGVRVEIRGRVGWITLDRPEVMNRIEGTMREQLLGALEQLAADPDVGCIAITGAGEAFSAGANVAEMSELQRAGDAAEIRRRVALGARVVRVIRELPKPVVAALDGVAAGAGMNLAMACDLRVGSSRAGFAASFVRIGLLPDWGGLALLARRVGMGRAAELMMTGRRVDSEEALAIGLLEHRFAEDFEAEVRKWLDRLAAAPREALASIKRGLNVGVDSGLEAVFDFERRMQPRLFLEDDCREGLEAFLEKRAPRFGA